MLASFLSNFMLYGIISFIVLKKYSTAVAAFQKLSSKEFQDVATQLWFADSDRAKLDLNFQGKIDQNFKNKKDKAPAKFFSNDALTKMKNKPTVNKLLRIFDLYDQRSNNFDQEELRKRSDEFFQEILITNETKILQASLLKYGYTPASKTEDFKKALYDMWFSRYSRKKAGAMGSSGFQHVFIGEIDQRQEQVSGLHNWIRFFTLEQKGDIDYAGYQNNGTFISAIRYKWKGNWKLLGSMFTGTSPEFDFSIFTLCFIANPGRGRCRFLIGDCTEVKITSMALIRNQKSARPSDIDDNSTATVDNPQIGTVYPETGKIVKQCDIRNPETKASSSVILDRFVVLLGIFSAFVVYFVQA